MPVVMFFEKKSSSIETQMHGRARRSFRGTVLDSGEFHIIEPDDTVTDRAVAGVYAKNDHNRSFANVKTEK